MITKEQIQKLPKWAQEHIVTLERQREEAIEVMNRALDTQTKSNIYYDRHVCTGEEGPGATSKRVFVQSDSICVQYADVSLRVLLRHGGKEIDLQWNSEDMMREVAFIPHSFQSARLVAKQHMR